MPHHARPIQHTFTGDLTAHSYIALTLGTLTNYSYTLAIAKWQWSNPMGGGHLHGI